jgi:hypothetical protein
MNFVFIEDVQKVQKLLNGDGRGSFQIEIVLFEDVLESVFEGVFACFLNHFIINHIIFFFDCVFTF